MMTIEKRASQIKEGDYILFNGVFEEVFDVRYIRDGFVHIYLFDGAATSIRPENEFITVLVK